MAVDINSVDESFVTDVFSEQEANVIVMGVGCPPSLRSCSRLVEPFDVEKQRNLLENVRIFDAGDVHIEELGERIKTVWEKQKLPLILGGKHTLTLYAARALPKGSRLVVFDAHADLKDTYAAAGGDARVNCATWLRRACERFNPADIALVGVRSCDEDVMKSSGLKYFTAGRIKTDISGVKSKLLKFVDGVQSLYVSIDVDVFDPSIAPAVENPEPDGLLYREFFELIDAVFSRKLNKKTPSKGIIA